MSSSNEQNNIESNSEGWKSISTYSILKPFGGIHDFMLSYGLKPWDYDSYDEAHAIIDEMKKADWEEIQRQRANN